MTRFLQLHLITAYPPSNLNRDDTGRPKTARFGDYDRLRVSSQSLKRAFRTSEPFARRVGAAIGTRTKRVGEEIVERLVAAGVDEAAARERAASVAGKLGKLESGRVSTEQLVHLSPEERNAIDGLVARWSRGEKTEDADLDVLTNGHKAADIAMFGRMLAADPQYNREAAVQVAHAITTHRAMVEDDYFTAVDDLKDEEDDRGAGHVGELGFAAGTFYLYLCVDEDLLLRNLQGDADLAGESKRALVEAAATVSPRGKQASFASRAYASYLLAERGTHQPRTLATAFLKPVEAGDQASHSIRELRKIRDAFARAYGPGWDSECEMDVPGGTGTLQDVVAFAGG